MYGFSDPWTASSKGILDSGYMLLERETSHWKNLIDLNANSNIFLYKFRLVEEPPNTKIQFTFLLSHLPASYDVHDMLVLWVTQNHLQSRECETLDTRVRRTSVGRDTSKPRSID